MSSNKNLIDTVECYNEETGMFYPTNQKEEYLAKIIYNDKEQLVLLQTESKSLSFEKKETRIDKAVEAKSSLHIDECYIVNDDSQNSISCSTTLDKNTLEEMLIEEIRKRPPLYDYTLPLSAHGRHKLAELWKEISNALNGHISSEDAKKRWKTLKDTFSKAVAEGKKPSTSARSNSQKLWKHFEAMSFLRSVSTNRKCFKRRLRKTAFQGHSPGGGTRRSRRAGRRSPCATSRTVTLKCSFP
ncbi:uncharacterized protein LOC112637667 [Camponotus floridanus]|uniref:uncharacterized protein LOC112637667 n=1 Tax=Camponotus floridanus TaxID=104421 RepID=UPI000DC6A538|nr:uncharacterized protein LOC112637667 [Camponotus floridanus]